MNFFLRVTLVLVCGFLTTQANATLYGLSEVDNGLYRGSRPSSIEDYQELRDHGIKTILSLESSSWTTEREKQMALENGFIFINTKISSFFPHLKDAVMIDILKIMQNESLKPVYLHCLFGRDRTGLAVGLYRIHVQNWTPDAAYGEMREFGFRPYLVWGLFKYFKTHTAHDSLMLPDGNEPR